MRILITGATSGIAYLLGKELIKRNHTVYFTTRTVKELYSLKEKLKTDKLDALCFKMDITTSDIELVDKIQIDCLINHAGIGIGGSLLYMDIEGLKENYEVNIFSSFKLLKRVYQNMEKDKIKGKIFVMSSLASMLPIPFLGCYTSSKAAISMLVKTIREELKYLNSDITISLIEPGAYKTGFNQVMIDNKSKYLEKGNKIYENTIYINRMQRNLFALMEKKDYSSLVFKIVKEIEKNNPKFLISEPLLQRIFAKIYFLFH